MRLFLCKSLGRFWTNSAATMMFWLVLNASAAQAQDATEALSPQAAALIDQFQQAAAETAPMPQEDTAWITASRDAYRAVIPLAGLPAKVARVEDKLITVRGIEIPIRLYVPANLKGAALVVYFHGGGFTAGDLDTHDAPLRELANAANAVVISVAYRLAPEHPFPAAIDDAYAAFLWAVDHADTLGADPMRVVVMGDSAGGNLAAVTALKARDEGGPVPAAQVLIYPNTDLTLGRDYASVTLSDGLVINRRDMDRNINLYTRSAAERASPYASVLLAGDLSNLAPAYVVTAGADPLRDEGVAYANRLRTAGNRVTHSHYPGMIHGFFQMGGALDAAGQLIVELATVVRAIPRADAPR